MEKQQRSRQLQEIDWASRLPEDEARIYHQVLAAAVARKLPFVIGGGFAFSVHSGRWRYTRDVDLYVEEKDRQTFIDLLHEHGFEDYYPHKAYDRAWIYRSLRDNVIVDIIWQMANQHAAVDASWIERGSPIRFGDLSLRALAPEELIWAKLFVVQRDRCDWPDLLNVINMQGATMDWDHLLNRVGQDRLLLSAVMCMFRWMCPAGSQSIPADVWERLGLGSLPMRSIEQPRRPEDLLDSREWFGPDAGQNPCRAGL